MVQMINYVHFFTLGPGTRIYNVGFLIEVKVYGLGKVLRLF